MKNRSFFFVCLLILASNTSFASTEKDFEFVATVNGAPITKGLFEINLRAAFAQGQKDSPQLREAIKNELINRQLIAQETVKQGLDKEIDLQDQITQLKQNLYLQVLIENHFTKNPITTEQLREEYNKQKQQLGNGTDSATQYKISQIVLKSEAEAIAVIGRLQAGETFVKAAKEVSLDAATKSQGGLLGWVSVQQLAPPIANVVANLNKGNFSKSPIRIGDAWVIVRVDDTRSSKIPSFEASQNQLKQALVQQYLGETIKRLRESAKIIQ
ncbi:peptidylprolyl isomerase [Polynucleobacter sp. MWH-Creno-3A4]|jgi:peptidyl-prolyl cis-trans isomerase C|uniref:peptidylprolyl isomerase n=1 Tax=Polynucleobacter sp. MWH-Creno-3A4 TaxID=1855886 RepID=UPI001C0DC7D6|nr:peptidylprolyl isomerase [Polynucleobacter sp. MWH-Creno-3A4]MBU3605141.1 peptidylprolyl isomerase [Polynucleobacter sp. MWH-Creno-3A4]